MMRRARELRLFYEPGTPHFVRVRWFDADCPQRPPDVVRAQRVCDAPVETFLLASVQPDPQRYLVFRIVAPLELGPDDISV